MTSTTHGNCSACGEQCPYTAVICSMCSSRLPWATASNAATRNMVQPTTHLPAVRLQSAPVPMAPTAVVPAAMGQMYCNSCGTANLASASFCSGCGQAMITAAINQASSAMWAGAQQAPPQQGNFNAPQASNGGANVNVTVVNKTNNSGWWAAVLLLIFGTPLGCIAIPLALVLFVAAFQFTPMIIAIVIIPFIWKSSLDPQIKPIVIGGVFMAGAIANAIMLASLRP